MNTKWFRCQGLSRQGIAAFSSLALMLIASGPAWAAVLEITLTDSRGGGPTTIVDGAAGDADGVVNQSISVNSVLVGGYTFTGVLSTTNSPGVAGVAQVKDNFTVENTSGGGAGTAQIYASSNAFTDPTGASIFQVTTATFLQNSIGGSGVGTVTSFIAPNALTTTPTGVVAGTATSPPTTLSTPDTVTSSGFVAPLPATYALNLLLSLALPAGTANFSNTSQVSLFGVGRGLNPAPEPATMLMWGFGALGMVALRLRRRNS